ncbi:ketosteroid isomerase [Siansivirga zeaxanthinifaciens CC-SAMT-1]|uniref:Ketosteroid isomerase n=1 Tax=Siansivirga zeaxanthinifaciens CC-SAMT-1 TaxID=1454006 RepID=A0A0C5W034_9FLAO|nr:ketosteroid isomerase [Siansivirga zeaxanthinifaciens CC-SAMT-1]
MSNPENLTVITNLYDAFSKGDIPTVLSLLDPQVVWNEAEGNAYADGNPYIGPNAVLEGVFSRVGNDYEYFNLADIKLHDMSNNEVLATLRYKGKLKKNGALLDAQVAHHFSLRDGKVITFQQYVDTKQLHDVNK